MSNELKRAPALTKAENALAKEFRKIEQLRPAWLEAIKPTATLQARLDELKRLTAPASLLAENSMFAEIVRKMEDDQRRIREMLRPLESVRAQFATDESLSDSMKRAAESFRAT